jgi:hypothetical protein
VDVGCTKIAIDLLSLTHDTLRAGLPQALRDLRAAAHVDAAFLVLFDEAGSAFESVRVERSDYSSCRLERLQHLKLTDLPHIASRSATANRTGSAPIGWRRPWGRALSIPGKM